MKVTVTRPVEPVPEKITEPERAGTKERFDETRITGPKSKRLAAEIAALRAARAEQESQEIQLVKELAEHMDALNVLRATSLVTEIDRDQVIASEGKLVDLQAKLDEVRSSIAGLDALLAERRQTLEMVQVEDAREVLDKNAKALSKSRDAVLETLEAGIRGMQEADLWKKWEKWRELVQERWHCYDALYRVIEGIGGDEDRKMRLERSYDLFPDDVAGSILDLAEILLPLFEIESGWPSVRGRKRQRWF